eukprot:4123052-Amphidinium_carterae.1
MQKRYRSVRRSDPSGSERFHDGLAPETEGRNHLINILISGDVPGKHPHHIFPTVSLVISSSRETSFKTWKKRVLWKLIKFPSTLVVE